MLLTFLNTIYIVERIGGDSLWSCIFTKCLDSIYYLPRTETDTLKCLWWGKRDFAVCLLRKCYLHLEFLPGNIIHRSLLMIWAAWFDMTRRVIHGYLWESENLIRIFKKGVLMIAQFVKCLLTHHKALNSSETSMWKYSQWDRPQATQFPGGGSVYTYLLLELRNYWAANPIKSMNSRFKGRQSQKARWQPNVDL